MSLLQLLQQVDVEGPFGGIDAARRSNHAPQLAELSEPARRILSLVWQGRLPQALLMDGEVLHLVEYCPAGLSRAGRRYGYTIRTVTFPPAASASRSRLRSGRMTSLLAVIAFLCEALLHAAPTL